MPNLDAFPLVYLKPLLFSIPHGKNSSCPLSLSSFALPFAEGPLLCWSLKLWLPPFFPSDATFLTLDPLIFSMCYTPIFLSPCDTLIPKLSDSILEINGSR